MRARIASTLAAVTLVLAVAEARGDYFPIVDGMHWRYAVDLWGSPDGEYTATFDGVVTIDGQPRHILRHAGDWYDGSVSYWSRDPSGDVHMNWEGQSPRLFLDLPLFDGQQWTATIPSSSGPVTIRSRVHGPVSVTVPAGTFQAFGVSRFSDEIYYATDYFADDVGMIARYAHDPNVAEQLLTLPGSVAVVAKTWSGVRSLYR